MSPVGLRTAQSRFVEAYGRLLLQSLPGVFGTSGSLDPDTRSADHAVHNRRMRLVHADVPSHRCGPSNDYRWIAAPRFAPLFRMLQSHNVLLFVSRTTA